VWFVVINFKLQLFNAAGQQASDGAETIYRELPPLFRRLKRNAGEETKEGQERDEGAFCGGKREGELIIRNVKLKVIAGVHEVIERKIEGGASIHEKKDAEFDE
jgi:hypothetical protein